ncbi:MAG TPA: NUDIX domain-containing protein, partial [Streptosporangiaceae bacterium]
RSPVMPALKESVAVVIRDQDGRFLVTERPDDPDDELAGLWGFPAATRRPGEDPRSAALRIGPLKLGVTLTVGAKLGEMTGDRGSYLLRLAEYAATIEAGRPSVPQPDDSVTQYAACRFTSEPGLLRPAARRGSLCARIFLQSVGQDWRGE